MHQLSFEQLWELFSYSPKGRPLSSREVAALLFVHPGTVDQFRLRGDGPRYFQPTGTRRVWYAERDVLGWMASNDHTGSDDIMRVFSKKL